MKDKGVRVIPRPLQVEVIAMVYLGLDLGS